MLNLRKIVIFKCNSKKNSKNLCEYRPWTFKMSDSQHLTLLDRLTQEHILHHSTSPWLFGSRPDKSLDFPFLISQALEDVVSILRNINDSILFYFFSNFVSILKLFLLVKCKLL